MFWRTWHLRNELIFGKGKDSVSNSPNFVDIYWSLPSSCHSNAELVPRVNGKAVADGIRSVSSPRSIREVWQPLPLDYIKINVHISFVESICVASVEVVARNSAGDVLISSWDYLGLCIDVDEVELRACLAGLYIGVTLHCSFVVFFLAHDNLDRSFLVDLKKKALAITKILPNFRLVNMNRRANVVAH